MTKQEERIEKDLFRRASEAPAIMWTWWEPVDSLPLKTKL